MLALSVASSLAQWPRMLRGAFTAAECDAIAQLFLESSATAEIDERTSEGVNRVNRWDTDNRLRDSGRLDGVYARVASSLGVDLDVKGMTEFTLMHEFTREHNFFGWHVDSSPGDGKPPRTLNVNVMLSAVGVDYTGGQLQVGDTNVSAQKGDLYLYPAAFPHAVHDLQAGVRRTLVIALVDKEADAASRAAYFARAATEFARLTAGPLAGESKMHLLHAEFLEASGADEAAAARARCLSFKVTAEAPQYAEHFAGEAARALQHVAAAGGGAESAETLRAAAGLVEMAECIREGSAAQARAALDYYRVAVDHMGGAQRGGGGGGRGAG